MKNMICRYAIALMTALCMMGLPFTSDGMPCNAARAEAPTAGETYVVKAGKLNLRSGPGKAHKSIAKLKRGTEVTFRNALKNWWYVDSAKGTGYVDNQYLKKKAQDNGGTVPVSTNVTNASNTTSTTTPTHVTTTRVRLRFKPSSKSKAMGWLEKDSNVIVLSEKGKWSQIPFHERKVWVCSKYLAKLQQNQ